MIKNKVKRKQFEYNNLLRLHKSVNLNHIKHYTMFVSGVFFT